MLMPAWDMTSATSPSVPGSSKALRMSTSRVLWAIPGASLTRSGEVFWQFEQVATRSLPIVAGAGVSVGLVTWLQTHRLLAAHGAESALPGFLAVAVVVEIGRGRLEPSALARFLAESSEAPARLTAPASGLFLERVYYDGDARETEVRPATGFP